MEKRGASNIEFIISFILFIGFIATIFYFFNPIRSVSYMDSSLKYVIGEIENNVSIELDEVSVFIKDSAPDSVKFEIPQISKEKKVDAINYYGVKFPAKRNSNIVYIDRKKGSDKETFIILRFSEEFKEESVDGKAKAIDKKGYEISTQDSRKVISENKVEQLRQLYDSNYLKLKEELGIPANIDFAFSLEMSGNNKIEAKRSVPGRAEVFAKGKLVEVLKKDETTETGYLTIKIW